MSYTNNIIQKFELDDHADVIRNVDNIFVGEGVAITALHKIHPNIVCVGTQNGIMFCEVSNQSLFSTINFPGKSVSAIAGKDARSFWIGFDNGDIGLYHCKDLYTKLFNKVQLNDLCARTLRSKVCRGETVG